MARGLKLWLIVVSLGVLLAGCGGSSGSEEAGPPEPMALLTEAATNIRAASTFRLDVTQGGAPYPILILLPGNIETEVSFRRALAQYVAPDMLQGTVSVVAGVLAQDVNIFSKGFDQWVQFIGLPWQRADFAPGFNPQTLIAEDTGFQAALSSLTELNYVGEATLEDGTPVYHLTGTADGPSVQALLVDLIDAQEAVDVEVYIHRETRYPVRLVIIQPETVTPEEPEPTTWTVDVYDVDAEPELDMPPDAEATDAAPETTPESTPESAPQSTPEATPGA